MGTRGEAERKIAASERDEAAHERAMAETGGYAAVQHLRKAEVLEERARLHERLADVYDREDASDCERPQGR